MNIADFLASCLIWAIFKKLFKSGLCPSPLFTQIELSVQGSFLNEYIADFFG